MPATEDHEIASGAFDIVGRVQPTTAAEMLASSAWSLYAVMIDQRTGRSVTMIRHARRPHVVLVEEPDLVTPDPSAPSIEDQEDPPGPWPDA